MVVMQEFFSHTGESDEESSSLKKHTGLVLGKAGHGMAGIARSFPLLLPPF
jgi:hypothetical protein